MLSRSLSVVFVMIIALSPAIAAAKGVSSYGSAEPPAPPSAIGPASIENGGFEVGDFSGWARVTNGSGTWTIHDGGQLPFSSHSFESPREGAFAAVTDQTGPGMHLLFRDLTVPSTGDAMLSFLLAYDNWNGSFHTPESFEISGIQNQQVRVDVLVPDANATTLDPADILATPFRTEVGAPANMTYTRICHDLSAHAGGNVTLRLAEVSTQYYLHAAVDDLRIGEGCPPTPPPVNATDLVASDLTAPTVVQPGSGMNVSARVSNAGGADATGPFSVVFRIDGQNVFEQNVAGLPAGAFTIISANLSAPSPGTHVLSFVVDADGNVSESSETNNVVDRSFEVGSGQPPANDLRENATQLVAPASVNGTNAGATLEAGEPTPCGAIGKTVWFRFVAIGNGNATLDTLGSNFDTVLAAYRSGETTPLACNDDTDGLTSRIEFGLVAGQAYDIQLGGYGAMAGSFTLNVATSIPGIDLVTTFAGVDGAPVAGAGSTLRGVVRNTGQLGASNFSVSFRIDGALVAQRNVSSLAAGANVTVTANVTMPAAGIHNLSIHTDSLNSVNETNESNNARNATFSVALPPRPAVAVFWNNLRPMTVRTEWGEVRHPLGRHEATLVVCNYGPVPASNGTAYLTVRGGTPSAPGAGATSLPSRVTSGLGSGSCAFDRFVFDTPGVVGDFTLNAQVVVANDSTTHDNFANATSFRVVADQGGVVAPNGAMYALDGNATAAVVAEVGNATVRHYDNVIMTANYTVATLREAVEGSLATTLLNATESNACPRLAMACEQFQGDYGAGVLRPCRAPPTNNLVASILYNAFNPDHRTLNPLVDPALRSLPPTGVSLCISSPRELAYDATATVDGLFS